MEETERKLRSQNVNVCPVVLSTAAAPINRVMEFGAPFAKLTHFPAAFPLLGEPARVCFMLLTVCNVAKTARIQRTTGPAPARAIWGMRTQLSISVADISTKKGSLCGGSGSGGVEGWGVLCGIWQEQTEGG